MKQKVLVKSLDTRSVLLIINEGEHGTYAQLTLCRARKLAKTLLAFARKQVTRRSTAKRK